MESGATTAAEGDVEADGADEALDRGRIGGLQWVQWFQRFQWVRWDYQ